MQKRGLSGIISVVLLILIVIVAIGIVWVSVHPKIIRSLKSSFGENGKGGQVSCVNLDININKCVKDGDNYNVFVDRGSGNDKLGELRFSFDVLNDSEKTKVYSSVTDNLLGEFQKGKFYFSSSGLGVDEILSVRVAGIFENGDACGFSRSVNCYEENLEGSCGDGKINNGEQCDGDNLNGKICSDIPGFSGGTLSCGSGCNFSTDECTEDINLDCGNVSDYNGDFNFTTCTRKRFIPLNVRRLPVMGFHNAGTSDTTRVGAEYVRMIVAWYKSYNADGSFNFVGLDNTINALKGDGLKLVLTIRTNDPDRAECWFNINGKRGYNQVDSYPIDEQVWKNYVKNITDRYYVQPLIRGEEPVLVGIQLGNEWTSQFEVNDTITGLCSGDNPEKGSKITNLFRITREAIDEVSTNLPFGAKRIPLITFGITGAQRGALVRGFNPIGKFYDGFFDGNNGIFERNLTDGQDYSTGADKTEQFLLDNKYYYDYIDFHIRFDYYGEPGYVVDWIRNFLEENDLRDKGIISLEYAGPFHIYTTQYHEYIIPVSLSDSFYHGFDSIAWAPWNIGRKLKSNFWLMAMRDWNGKDRKYAIDGYKNATNLINGFPDLNADFEEVQRENDIYRFNDGINNLREINVSKNVPEIPKTFEQCSDELDNNNNGIIDGNSSIKGKDFCNSGNFKVDVEFNESIVDF